MNALTNYDIFIKNQKIKKGVNYPYLAKKNQQNKCYVCLMTIENKK